MTATLLIFAAAFLLFIVCCQAATIGQLRRRLSSRDYATRLHHRGADR